MKNIVFFWQIFFMKIECIKIGKYSFWRFRAFQLLCGRARDWQRSVRALRRDLSRLVQLPPEIDD